jgi:phosphatidylglycerol:prolipoprotein diacylglycerol transferase
MYGEMEVLFRLGPLSVTPYSLMMGLAFLLALAVTFLTARRVFSAERIVTMVCLGTVAAILGGHLVYSLAFFPALEVDYGGYSFIARLHEGGSTLFGAVFFVMLACYLLAKHWHVRTADLMDAAAPGAAVAICVGRIAEYFNGQGLGQAVEDAAFQRFPFAVCTYMDEEWSEWYLAVFVFEAAAGLILFAALLLLRRRTLRPGFLSGFFLSAFCASQIFLEQLRADDCIRFGFVRLTQICGLVVLVALLSARIVRRVRTKGWTWEETVLVVRFLAATFCVVFTEFAFEKPQYYPYLSACIVLLALSIACPEIIRARNGHAALHIGGAAISIILGGAMLYILTLGLENEWDYLYALMAACVSVMAFDACPRNKQE